MNSTSYAFTPLASTVAFPFYHYDRAEVYPGISDRYMSILAPFITYWVASLFFQTIDSLNLPFFEQHRLHEPEEVKTKNRVTVRQVVVAVLFQQFVQTLLGIVWLEDDDPAYGPMRDHAEAVGWYHAVLAKAAVSVLGGAMGSEVIKGYGASAASWVYWWGVPTVQLFFAASVQSTLHGCSPRVGGHELDALLIPLFPTQFRYGHLAVLPPPLLPHQHLPLSSRALVAPPTLRAVLVRRAVQPSSRRLSLRHTRRDDRPLVCVDDDATGYLLLRVEHGQDGRRSLWVRIPVGPATASLWKQLGLPRHSPLVECLFILCASADPLAVHRPNGGTEEELLTALLHFLGVSLHPRSLTRLY